MLPFIKKLPVILSISLLAGCGQVFEFVYCEYGYGGVKNNFFQTGVNLLNECLDLDHLSTDDRATYLQGRAWGHFNLENNDLALTDQEAAFELRPPTQISEFINHAAYLRRLQLYRKSLLALRSAEKIDESKGRPSMVTQYNLGWSLFELNRFEEAIEAFNKGIPQQPDYPFVYLRRGLAYLKQGNAKNASQDFDEFLSLVGDQQVNLPAELKEKIDKLPSKFSALQNL